MASSTSDETPKQSASLIDEIWGIVFLAVGVFVLLSLLGRFIQGPELNVFGKPGKFLANGLLFIAGPLPAILIPVGILFCGWNRLRAQEIRIASFALWCAIIVELCILFDIHNIYDVATALTVDPFNSAIGYIGVRPLEKIFGPNPLGPYFLLIVLLLISIMLGLQVNLSTIFGWVKYAIAFIKSMFPARSMSEAGTVSSAGDAGQKKEIPSQVKASKAVRAAAAAPATIEAQAASTSSPLSQETVAPVEPVDAKGDPAVDSAENLAKKRLEDELSAFRAKKDQPINIITEETAPEPDPLPEEADLPAIDPEAVIEIVADPDLTEEKHDESTMNGPDMSSPHEEEMYRIPEEIPIVKSIPSKPYEIPLPDILPEPPVATNFIDRDYLQENSAILEKTLLNFGVEGKVVNVSPGPVITRYEIELAPGVKVSKVLNLHDDLAMAVGGQKIRIQAPIPGKAAVGIELPNKERQIVYFKHILDSDAFQKTKARLPVIIGKTISGQPYVLDITRMPHLLIAGQTGSGKSVCINSIICSLLMNKKPDELRLILIDPKKVELAYFEGIPHLLSPVVTESKEAVRALQWGVIEMERRYRLLAKVGARNIESFNQRVATNSFKAGAKTTESENALLPFIMIVVDELADLMLTASRDVEGLIQRIAQLARAVGIHLIVATQRPSVDIITGPIKANLTSRIAFRTIQSVDSRTILGYTGAEKLLGMGDMLCLRSGAPDIERYHGAFLSEEEVEKIVADIRKQNIEIEKIQSFEEATGGSGGEGFSDSGNGGGNGDKDELFKEAARIIVGIGQGSTSLLQRRMKIGFARAGRLMDELCNAGVVGQQEGSKVREVLVKPEELEKHLAGL